MISLPINAAHDLFASPLTVYDETNTRNARGEGSRTVAPARTIAGVIQPAGDRALRLLPQGASPDGAMVMHTAGTIHTGEGSTQTYLQHAGQVWRVWAIQAWGPHSDIRRYLCTRHVRTD
jgi:hypothetical protein